MKTNNLLEILKENGIKAQPYKRPPIGEDVFALSIRPGGKEGIVIVNQGKAKVEAYGSKKHRQVTATVTEDERVVTRDTINTVHDPKNHKPKPERVERLLRQKFNVIMPSNATWTVTNVVVKWQPTTWIRTPDHPDGELVDKIGHWKLSGTVTATVGKKTVNHFLIGVDESHNFIAALPRKARSVRQAHALLRPNGVLKSNSHRQGEWFFAPCSTDMCRKLDEFVEKNPGKVRSFRLGVRYNKHHIISNGDRITTHVAKSGVSCKQQIYVRGFITDDRAGHHKSIFLKSWHRVVRNKESEIKVDEAQRAAARRRRATWD